MSQTNLNEFHLHNISSNIITIQSTILIAGLIKIILLLQIFLHRKRSKSEPSDQEKKVVDHDDLTIGEMEMETVLKRLGIFCDVGDQVQTKMDADEIFGIFEERRPCLDEVKEAFGVFDSNGDGMIDEKELQKVLCALGLKEGLEIEKCGRMIEAFDENGDGRIDFDEFVKFMENSFT